MIRHTHWTLIALIALAELAAADSITMWSSARSAPDATTVQLSDIATLKGPNASAFASLSVGEIHGQRGTTITVGQVRQALDAAGAHWGRIDLHGAATRVSAGPQRATTMPLAMQPIRLRASAVTANMVPRTQSAAALTDGNTLKNEVVRFLVATLDTTPDRLRVVFDDSDEVWLSDSLEGSRYQIRPMSNQKLSDRLDLEIRRWQAGRPGERRLLKVKPLVRCTVAEAAADIPRSNVITPAHINEVEVWLTPSQRSIRLEGVDVVGRLPVAPIRKGTILRARDVRAIPLVDRGDQVTVRCLVGGAAIALRAKAESAGGLGETIELRRGRERETFTATVCGPREAVIDLAPRTNTQVASAVNRTP
jgi:flagella basal body P-ring formation protein FlgA